MTDEKKRIDSTDEPRGERYYAQMERDYQERRTGEFRMWLGLCALPAAYIIWTPMSALLFVAAVLLGFAVHWFVRGYRNHMESFRTARLSDRFHKTGQYFEAWKKGYDKDNAALFHEEKGYRFVWWAYALIVADKLLAYFADNIQAWWHWLPFVN